MVLQAWIASRGLIAAITLLLAVQKSRSLTEMVSNWDVDHFTKLAEGGYYADPRGILMATLLSCSAGHPAGRPGAGRADRDHGRRLVHALLSGGSGRADPARWPVGRDRMALRADGGVHDSSLIPVALLRSRLLGVGAGTVRSLAGLL